MAQTETTKIFLADRYGHFRDNLKGLFRKKDIEVIGEADAAEDLLRNRMSTQACKQQTHS